MANKAYSQWYGLAIWKRLRLEQLRKEPLCHMCRAVGDITPATVANHTIAHKGDWELFTDPGNLDSLCKRHHDSDQQSFEKSGKVSMSFDDDGWPIEISDPELLPPPRDLFFPAIRASKIPLEIVYGPAAAGKSTYVSKNKGEKDVVIDMEEIKLRLFGFERGGEWPQIRAALRHRNAILRSLSNRPTNSNYKAWFITTCQKPEDLEHWKRALSPQSTRLFIEPQARLMCRVRRDAARLGAKDTQHKIISEWFEAWGIDPVTLEKVK